MEQKIIKLNTYSESDKFYAENIKLGHFGGDMEIADQFNLWIVELYQNKITGQYSLFLTADEDEDWVIIGFEQEEKKC